MNDTNKDWFDDMLGESTADRILQEITRLKTSYKAELAKNLALDLRTVSRWVDRLEMADTIEQINTTEPNEDLMARLPGLRAAGMKRNHFKAAKWYRVASRGRHA